MHMILYHAPRCLCILFWQLNNVGTKWNSMCGELSCNVEVKTTFQMSHASFDWTSNACSRQGQGSNTSFLVWRCRLCISLRLGGCKCWLFVIPSTLVVCDVHFTTMGHNLWSLMAFTLATNFLFDLNLLPHNFSEHGHFTWVVLAFW